MEGPVSNRTGPRAIAGVLGGALALAIGLGGCGTGQQAQTAQQVTGTGGAEGRSASILVRHAQFAYERPIPGGTVYEPGADAPVMVTIVNDATTTVDDGQAADRLVAVSSPIATSGRIVGDATIPDGQVLTAGHVEPTTPPGSTAVEIALVGLTAPVRAGHTYPVVFTFERSGDVRVEMPVDNPDVLPPRATDAEPDVRTLETGPQPVEVPR